MTLIIKETTKQDLPHILTLWNHPEVMVYVGFPNGLGITMDKLEDWYDQLTQSTIAKHYSIYDDTTYCGETFYRLLKDGSCEVDIKLLPEARGKSIASTALSHTLSIVLFDHKVTHAKVDPHPDNIDAINLYKRLGFYRVENSERDMHVNIKTFKPSSRYLNTYTTIKTVPIEDYKTLWEISEKDDWYDYCNTNAPYFYEHKAIPFSQFMDENKDRNILGIYFRDTLIGVVNSYWEHKGTRWLEIGLVLYDSKFWGKGIGTHALRWMTEYCFHTYPEIERVGFVTWSGNIGMMKTGNKAHFKCEAHLRKVRYFEGTYYDSVRYGLTRTEYEAFRRASKCIQITNKHEKQTLCDALLRKNPHHFGIESSIVSYVDEIVDHCVFSTPDKDGFIGLMAHSDTTLEINVMALDPTIHRHGLGTDLLNRAVMYGREHGYKQLLVKTLAASHPDVHYKNTRLFYEAFGFLETQRFDTLWGVENPCQEYMFLL